MQGNHTCNLKNVSALQITMQIRGRFLWSNLFERPSELSQSRHTLTLHLLLDFICKISTSLLASTNERVRVLWLKRYTN